MRNAFDFTALPGDLLRPLLLGFSGKLHLHAIAAKATEASRAPQEHCSRIRLDALLAAWAENPFDTLCAARAAQSELLPPQLMPLVKGVVGNWRSEVTDETSTTMNSGTGQQLALIMSRLKEDPTNIFWWHHLYDFSRINGDWSALQKTLAAFPHPAGLEPLFHYAQANALLAGDDPEAALHLYQQSATFLPFPTIQERIATALIRLHAINDAADILHQAALTRPWNVNLWLRLYELRTGGYRNTQRIQGHTTVLAYSYNKADDLAQTLNSLAASDLGEATVRVVDNGSQDTTADVIRQFVDRFGIDKAHAISLPVNIGAPAARNWLMQLPEVQSSDFTAYIDDDISLPKDWLTRLGAAVDRYPQAGVWGCKVVDHQGHTRVQSGEHNLTFEPQERRSVLMATPMLQESDFGQSDYIRPCTSVTGCVHLFRTAKLLDTGPFDIRFSPTQYDDLERDLRMVLAGDYAVYQGFLAIPHKRKSGKLSDAHQPESSNALGNMYKLMNQYKPEQLERMAGVIDQVLLDDLLTKMASMQR